MVNMRFKEMSVHIIRLETNKQTKPKQNKSIRQTKTLGKDQINNVAHSWKEGIHCPAQQQQRLESLQKTTKSQMIAEWLHDI